MGVLVATTFGLVLWVVGYAFGLKSFDVFMLTVAIITVAFTVRTVMPFVNRLTGRDVDPDAV